MLCFLSSRSMLTNAFNSPERVNFFPRFCSRVFTFVWKLQLKNIERHFDLQSLVRQFHRKTVEMIIWPKHLQWNTHDFRIGRYVDFEYWTFVATMVRVISCSWTLQMHEPFRLTGLLWSPNEKFSINEFVWCAVFQETITAMGEKRLRTHNTT